MKQDKKNLKNTILIISIIAAFTFLVSIAYFHTQKIVKDPFTCEYRNILPILVLITSSLGVFVGSFVYYKISRNYLKEKKEYKKEAEITLSFLGKHEKSIVQILIRHKGEIKQAQLEKLTKINKVSVHRKLKKLLEKNVITKEQSIQGNTIRLTEPFRKIFIKE